ncbi:MAG: SprT family zinc-dependent metalloprotease [Alphaproteobacteria bacterium]|nr:SprT family zinc-dependent metalloprotease [Alphaproteobacteria bacterium]
MPAPTETRVTVPLNGQETVVVLRRHPRARRLKLQVDGKLGLPVLTLPPGVSEAEGLSFLNRNAGWTQKRMETLPDKVDLAPGVIMPFRGRDFQIDHQPDARGTVTVDGDRLIVSGGVDHLSRRVTDFCKKEAKAAIKPLAGQFAADLNRKPSRISIRDQRTRWGSCASNGDLSFSWRLILAPPHILDYVVAHEVAHLVHMNHSPAFWKTVEQIYPDYDRARDWLGSHGTRLHRIG